MPLLYLASPYTHKDHAVEVDRAAEAVSAFARLLQKGVHVYSPIAAIHHVRDKYTLPGDWQFWAEYDKLMIDACDSFAVLTLPGWRESVGVTEEIKYAKEKGRNVLLLEPTTLEFWTNENILLPGLRVALALCDKRTEGIVETLSAKIAELEDAP